MQNRSGNKVVDEWLKPEKLELLSYWARDFSLGEIAEKIGVTRETIWAWKKKYPEIANAIKDGKEIVDYRVESALLKVALGYTTREVKTFTSYPDKQGNRRTRTETLEKEMPPNPTAIMCWLNNRKPDQWKRNRDNIMSTNDKDNNITVNIIKHSGKKEEKESNDEWTVETNKKPKAESKKAKTELTEEEQWELEWNEAE